MLEPLQESVGSLGFIIIAPHTGCCNDHGQDMLHVLDWVKNNHSITPLHKALDHADWSRAGIYGHSFGSAWATDAVRRAQNDLDTYPVKAAVFSHGGHTADDITIPSMFTTGRGGGSDWNMYSACPADHKVYAAAKGAGHMEPIQGGRLNAFDGHFFGCHVKELQTSCDKIYGDGDDSICKAQEMDGCDVTQPSEVVA
jgi:alpha/beta superfamily hydrolase